MITLNFYGLIIRRQRNGGNKRNNKFAGQTDIHRKDTAAVILLMTARNLFAIELPEKFTRDGRSTLRYPGFSG